MWEDRGKLRKMQVLPNVDIRRGKCGKVGFKERAVVGNKILWRNREED